MWEYVDKELKKYIKDFKKNNNELKYRIQNIFNMGFTYEDLYKYANKQVLNQFKTRIRLFKENYTKNDYVSYIVNKWQNRTLVKNNEILQVMLLMEYAEIYDKNLDEQMNLFKRVTQEVAVITNKECKKLRPLHRMYNYEWTVIIHLLALPNNLGSTWEEHIQSAVQYNTNEVYKQAVIDLRQNKLKVHDEILEKQQKREINYKPSNVDDKFYGQIDNELTYLVNQERVQIFKYYGIKRVIFKAVIDDRTTEVCEEMNGKIIDIDKLVLAVNLPPLHFNCRSVIEAYKVV